MLLVWLVASAAADRTVPGNPLIDIPGGAFVFGSDGGAPNEAPARRLELAAFRINKFEITNAQYGAMAAATGAPPAFYRDHPVLGARPEDLTITTAGDGHLSAAIYSVELTGDATLVTLRLRDGFVALRADKDFDQPIDTPIAVRVAPDKVFLFDAETEERIRA